MTLADVVIRPATLSDVVGMRRLLVETWHDTYDPLLGARRVTEITGRWHAVEALARQLDLPGASFLVAERAAIIVGHAFAREQPSDALFLARLYVLPAHQRQGIGSRLLKAVAERHPSARRIKLQVEAENAKGVAFYGRHGFVVVGEIMEEGLKSLSMERELGAAEPA